MDEPYELTLQVYVAEYKYTAYTKVFVAALDSEHAYTLLKQAEKQRGLLESCILSEGIAYGEWTLDSMMPDDEGWEPCDCPVSEDEQEKLP